MGIDAGTPPGLWERVRAIAAEEVAKFMRSGFLRNASITDGALTIRGGVLKLLFGDVALFYVGPVTPSAPDGAPQQGLLIRRSDGTLALALYDASPDDATAPNQALTWWDRARNIVMSDDTDAGQGIARPWLDHAFYPSRAQDFLTTTAADFETVWRAKMSKQQPRLHVEGWGVSNDAGAVGEVRVMVNGTQLGEVRSTSSGLVAFLSWDGAVDGEFGELLNVEIQARRAAGTGGIRVGSAWVQGRQS